MPALVALLLATVVSVGTAAPQSTASAPAPKNETATEFYQRFRAVVDKAKSIDEVKPFWSTELISQFNTMPPAEQATTLDRVKQIESHFTGLKVVKETSTGSGAHIALEAFDEKTPMIGTVDLVKEQGAWKIESAEWRPKD